MVHHVDQLLRAARLGDVRHLKDSLASGACPNAADRYAVPVLVVACHQGDPACVAALLRAGARPNASTPSGCTPLIAAVCSGSTACIALLLAAGADPLDASHHRRWLPLHFAAFSAPLDVVRLVLQAQPLAAHCREAAELTPLNLALLKRRLKAAHCLLMHGPLQPAGDLLAVLGSAGAWAAPLYACVVARQRLTEEEWEHVPALLLPAGDSCDGSTAGSPPHCLGGALPAVLARSVQEAALLVQRLPPCTQQRLNVGALCLARVQRQLAVQLPLPLVWRMLALSAAGAPHARQSPAALPVA